jgi:hypothetical protein
MGMDQEPETYGMWSTNDMFFVLARSRGRAWSLEIIRSVPSYLRSSCGNWGQKWCPAWSTSVLLCDRGDCCDWVHLNGCGSNWTCQKKHDEFGYHCYFSRNSSNPFGLVRTLPTYTLCITRPYPFQDRLEGLHKTHSKTMRHLFKKRTGCCVLLFDFDKVKKKHAWRENRFWTTTPSESQGPPCQVGETVSTQTAPQRHRQWLNVNALELRLNFARQVWLFYSMPWINFSPTQPSTFWLLDIQMAISSRRIDSD